MVESGISDWSAQIQSLKNKSLYRKLRLIEANGDGMETLCDGQPVVNFASNDYLGLARHPEVRQAAADAAKQFGAGSGSSRLISGTQPLHRQLEEQIADWKSSPAALVFSSGFATAMGTIPAVVGKGDIIIIDKLAHACLVDASRLSSATIRVFPHNRLDKLESHLEWATTKHPQAKNLIVTESVFSMDGDLAPLHETVELKKRFNAMLMVDEAHAVGIYGENGTGLINHYGLQQDIDIQMGTLSKAIGSSGGYIAGSKQLVELLINKARSFIFSTAPTPATLATASKSIDLLRSKRGQVSCQTLIDNIRCFRELMGLSETPSQETDPHPSPIQPIIIGDEEAALQLSARLLDDGFLVPAIRYPTVARGSARLRVTLSSLHTEAQIERLAGCLLSGDS